MIDARYPELKCKFEPFGVNCDGRTVCERCGWNPGEKARRVDELRRMEKQGLPPQIRVKRSRIFCAMGFCLTCDTCGKENCRVREHDAGLS